MPLTTGSLIQEIDHGELALPEFQRDYKWPDDFIVELLRSVARGWPIGAFLMLEQMRSERLLSRAIEGAPAAKKVPRLLILDGQQRATALYQALTGKGKRNTTFYVDMKELRREDDVTDECIDAMRDKTFEREFGRGIDDNASNGVVRLQDLVSSSGFSTWLNHVSPNDADRKVYADLKDAHLAGFTGYPLRTETVSADLPMEAIAKIFERTNRSVLQLDAFDLMVAILFPHRRFNLRKRWESAKDRHPILDDYAVPGVEVLKVIALREHLRQREAWENGKLRKLNVRGVRQSDVLALDPRLVIREWTKAVAAYAKALELVKVECGAIRKKIVPQETMILPLADCLYGRRQALGVAARRKIRRWFWAVSFQRRYARGANTRAVSDARALRAWLKRNDDVPEDVEQFVVSKESFLEMDDGNDIATSAAICLLNTLGARDWSKAAARGRQARKLVDTPESTDLGVHHVFPLEFLETRVRRPRVAAEVPANQVLIDAGLNSSIRNAAPSSVLRNSKVISSAVASHFADRDKMRTDNYEGFVRARAELLAREARKAVTPAP